MTNPAAALIKTPLDDAWLSAPAAAAIVLIAVLLVIASAWHGARK